MDIIQLTFESLAYIMPAYIANASAVLFRGKTRLDMGYKFFDGRPILGKNKTIKGFVGAVLAGTVYSFFQSLFIPLIGVNTGFLLALGAMVGDSIGSFIKRRLDLRSGELAPFLDQWDFVLGAFLFVYLGNLFDSGIALPSLTSALLILVLTVVISLLTNFFAYLLKLKEVPW